MPRESHRPGQLAPPTVLFTFVCYINKATHVLSMHPILAWIDPGVPLKISNITFIVKIFFPFSVSCSIIIWSLLPLTSCVLPPKASTFAAKARTTQGKHGSENRWRYDRGHSQAQPSHWTCEYPGESWLVLSLFADAHSQQLREYGFEDSANRIAKSSHDIVGTFTNAVIKFSDDELVMSDSVSLSKTLCYWRRVSQTDLASEQEHNVKRGAVQRKWVSGDGHGNS